MNPAFFFTCLCNYIKWDIFVSESSFLFFYEKWILSQSFQFLKSETGKSFWSLSLLISNRLISITKLSISLFHLLNLPAVTFLGLHSCLNHWPRLFISICSLYCLENDLFKTFNYVTLCYEALYGWIFVIICSLRCLTCYKNAPGHLAMTYSSAYHLPDAFFFPWYNGLKFPPFTSSGIFLPILLIPSDPAL